jgi:hypothetical protein
MSGYTIKNLQEIDDAAPGFGLSPSLEARFGRKSLDCEKGGVSYEKLAPNFRVPFGHVHAAQEEVYVIASGSGRIKLEDEILDVKQWDFIRVSPGTTRNFEAGPDGMEIIAFGAGEAGDAETIPGWWAD